MAVLHKTGWAFAILVVAGVTGWFAFASSGAMAADGDEKSHHVRDVHGHDRDAKSPHASKRPAGHPTLAKHGHPGKDGYGTAASPHGRMNPLMLIMAHDLNNDGMVTKKELHQAIEHIFAQADANKDDAIDKKEAAKLGRPQHSRRPAHPKGK